MTLLFSSLIKMLSLIHCSLYLLAQRPNLEKNYIYSNKFFHNFNLPESSFTSPWLRASRLAQRLHCQVFCVLTDKHVPKTLSNMSISITLPKGQICIFNQSKLNFYTRVDFTQSKLVQCQEIFFATICQFLFRL